MHTAGSPKRSNGPPSRPPPPPPTEDRESDPADGSSAAGEAPPQSAPPRPGHGHHRHRSRDHHQRAPASRGGAEPDDREQDLLPGDDLGGPGTTRVVGDPTEDDTWMETTTAVTTTTFSEAGFSSVENMSRLNKDLELSVGFACARYVGTVVSGFIGLLAYVSPIVMIVLPKTGLFANMTMSPDGICFVISLHCTRLAVSVM